MTQTQTTTSGEHSTRENPANTREVLLRLAIFVLFAAATSAAVGEFAGSRLFTFVAQGMSLSETAVGILALSLGWVPATLAAWYPPRPLNDERDNPKRRSVGLFFALLFLPACAVLIVLSILMEIDAAGSPYSGISVTVWMMAGAYGPFGFAAGFTASAAALGCLWRILRLLQWPGWACGAVACLVLQLQPTAFLLIHVAAHPGDAAQLIPQWFAVAVPTVLVGAAVGSVAVGRGFWVRASMFAAALSLTPLVLLLNWEDAIYRAWIIVSLEGALIATVAVICCMTVRRDRSAAEQNSKLEAETEVGPAPAAGSGAEPAAEAVPKTSEDSSPATPSI